MSFRERHLVIETRGSQPSNFCEFLRVSVGLVRLMEALGPQFSIAVGDAPLQDQNPDEEGGDGAGCDEERGHRVCPRRVALHAHHEAQHMALYVRRQKARSNDECTRSTQVVCLHVAPEDGLQADVHGGVRGADENGARERGAERSVRQKATDEGQDAAEGSHPEVQRYDAQEGAQEKERQRLGDCLEGNVAGGLRGRDVVDVGLDQSGVQREGTVGSEEHAARQKDEPVLKGERREAPEDGRAAVVLRRSGDISHPQLLLQNAHPQGAPENHKDRDGGQHRDAAHGEHDPQGEVDAVVESDARRHQSRHADDGVSARSRDAQHHRLHLGSEEPEDNVLHDHYRGVHGGNDGDLTGDQNAHGGHVILLQVLSHNPQGRASDDQEGHSDGREREAR